MIASCWDWPSLKYAYFIIEGQPLDAGGWSPNRGIVAKDNSASGTDSIAFDDCLPSLPKNCYYAGAGDFCIGEMYTKRDSDERQSLDMNLIRSQGTPDMKKLVELLDDSASSVVGSLRKSPLTKSRGNPNGMSVSTPAKKPKRSLWGMLVPSFAAVGTGLAMYRLFSKESRTDLNVRTLLFAWMSGLAVGVTVGQEYGSEECDKSEDGA